jgi:hypothetical protein
MSEVLDGVEMTEEARLETAAALKDKYQDVIDALKGGTWVDLKEVRRQSIPVPLETFVVAKEVWENDLRKGRGVVVRYDLQTNCSE